MDKAELAFRLADKNKDGQVDKIEFEKTFRNPTKERTDKVLDHLDKNSDGKLYLSEFKDMTSGGIWGPLGSLWNTGVSLCVQHWKYDEHSKKN